MSTIKDTYGTLYTEAQIKAAEKLTFADFQPGVTYWVPEFVYQDIDGGKTKYYKLVERTISDLRLQADLVDFTSSKVGDLAGVAVKVVPVGKVVLFKLNGVNFNAGGGYGQPTIATNGGPYTITNPYRLKTDIGVDSIGVYIKLVRPSEDAGDYTDHYTMPAGITVNSVDTIDTGGDGWDHTYRLNCTIETDADKTIDITPIAAGPTGKLVQFTYGNTLDDAPIDGVKIKLTPVDAGGTQVGEDKLYVPDATNSFKVKLEFEATALAYSYNDTLKDGYSLPNSFWDDVNDHITGGDYTFADGKYVIEVTLDTTIARTVHIFKTQKLSFKLDGVLLNTASGQSANAIASPTFPGGSYETVLDFNTIYVDYGQNYNIGVNISLPKLGGAAFIDDYTLPDGFTIFDPEAIGTGPGGWVVSGDAQPQSADKEFNFLTA